MRPLRYLPALLLVILLVADLCKKFELNTDDLDLSINLDIIKTNFEITFTDAATGLPIGENDEVSVRAVIYGEDSVSVLDPSGYRYAEYVSLSGRILLSLDPYNAKPTIEDPVSFVVYAAAEGYMPASKLIETQREGSQYEVIQMVKKDMPPSGTDIITVENAGRAENGRVTDTLRVSTGNSGASIVLAAGTLLKDAAGTPLQGSLKVTLSSFSVLENESREAFPGGFSGKVDSAGTTKRGFMESAAFFNLEISDASGRILDQGSTCWIPMWFTSNQTEIWGIKAGTLATIPFEVTTRCGK